MEPAMDEFDSFDPGLFGIWRDRAAYGDEMPTEDAVLADEVRIALEIKSADGGVSASDELRKLLNDMTVEMREQFSTFRKMRESAAGALTDGDEAAQKLARADVKAATDAMSLIVRTLEKVDSLQRQLARDREIEAERVADEGGYGEAKDRLQRLIADKADERAKSLLATWIRNGAASDAEPRRAGTDPPSGTG
jgi:hypothetical protein